MVRIPVYCPPFCEKFNYFRLSVINKNVTIGKSDGDNLYDKLLNVSCVSDNDKKFMFSRYGSIGPSLAVYVSKIAWPDKG